MGRAAFIIEKIKRAAASGNLGTKTKRYVRTRFKRPFQVISGYMNSNKEDRQRNFKAGLADHRKKPVHYKSNPEHIQRIIKAYNKSKANQKNVPLPYQIRGLWEEWLEMNYRDLIKALKEEDADGVAKLFENLFREQLSNGAGGYDNYIRSRSLLGNLYIRHMWNTYRDRFEKLDGKVEEVDFPMIGNPLGAVVGDNIISYETLRHAYRGKEICELMKDMKGATLVEIGGGLGGEAFQTLNMNKGQIGKYYIFDIPELSAISAYFLMSAFPNKKIRLYGEGDVSFEESADFDIGIFPHFSVPEIPDNSVDLFYNSCSFSEMDQVSSGEYLKNIERAGRKYFLHVNHDNRFTFKYPDDSVSVNIIGSELIPEQSLFKRVYKKKRTHMRLEDYQESYEYLYERIK